MAVSVAGAGTADWEVEARSSSAAVAVAAGRTFWSSEGVAVGALRAEARMEAAAAAREAELVGAGWAAEETMAAMGMAAA
eukprot:271944-Pleurochrysis_carterae.AAC.1